MNTLTLFQTRLLRGLMRFLPSKMTINWNMNNHGIVTKIWNWILWMAPCGGQTIGSC
jgi:hypothetical protein